MKTVMTAVALAATLAVPTFALAQPGYHARAQSPRSGDMGVNSAEISAARARALKDCTALEQKWDQRSWGSQQLDVYRACMAQHGQME